MKKQILTVISAMLLGGCESEAAKPETPWYVPLQTEAAEIDKTVKKDDAVHLSFSSSKYPKLEGRHLEMNFNTMTQCVNYGITQSVIVPREPTFICTRIRDNALIKYTA